MPPITRFAPSPTGFLHIGGARTALFNWLYAKHHGGKFFLRIEDTDRTRSTQAAIDAIIDGMKWLGLDWEGDAVYQYARAARHGDVAHELVKHGQAYKCYATAEELAEFRKNNPQGAKFVSPWRDGGHAAPSTPYVIRIKAPLTGSITVQDKVQGEVTVEAKQLDDMVLLRSDGTPTYMLAVVVDDHDMGVTQIIRGDDHLTNTFRQLMIYNAMGWEAPGFAHIPLIHGPDGAKLSKRHGALGVDAYRDMGYLPEAMRNYLLRLGWSHGDDEMISTEQAIEWFDLDAVGKSPSRFDFAKLDSLNAHYIREADNAKLAALLVDGKQWTVDSAPSTVHRPPSTEARQRLIHGMPGLKARAKTLKELAENAAFYIERPPLDAKAQAILDNGGKDLLKSLLPELEKISDWGHAALEQCCRAFAEQQGKKLGDVAQPLRAALTGRTTSPPVFEVMEVLGREETLGRIRTKTH